MQTPTLIFSGLTMACLLMAGLSAKAMATVNGEAVSPMRRLLTLAFGLLAMLLGLLFAGIFLQAAMPVTWGQDVYWAVLLVGCAASVGMPVMRVVTRQHRAAEPAAAVAEPVVAAPAPASTVNVWPSLGLPAARAAVKAARVRDAQLRARNVLFVAVPVAVIGAFTFGIFAVAMTVVLTLAFRIGCYSNLDGIGEIEYRTLPGSTDAFGKHRCVYCGHRGVFRQGAYASNSTWSQCTGCRQHLFVD